MTSRGFFSSRFLRSWELKNSKHDFSIWQTNKYVTIYVTLESTTWQYEEVLSPMSKFLKGVNRNERTAADNPLELMEVLSSNRFAEVTE